MPLVVGGFRDAEEWSGKRQRTAANLAPVKTSRPDLAIQIHAQVLNP